MNRLTDEQIDKMIKDKFKQDSVISKQAEMAFRNFDPNKFNKTETETNSNVYKVKPVLSFYQKLNRVLSVAAISLSVLVVGGTALYFKGDKTTEQVLVYEQNLVKNQKLNIGNEMIMKTVKNKFVTAYLMGKRDVGVNLTSEYWNEFEGTFTSTDCYKIDNIDKDVKDIFIGEIGNHGLPYVFLLMEDNTIEYVDLQCFYNNSFYYEAKRLEGLDNVVGLEQKSRQYPYSTSTYDYVNAIRADGVRKEIEIGVVNDWSDTVNDDYQKAVDKYVQAHNQTAIIDDGKGDFMVDGKDYLSVSGETKYAYYTNSGKFYRVERATAVSECMATCFSSLARDNADGRISVTLSDGYEIFIQDKNIIFKNSKHEVITTTTNTPVTTAPTTTVPTTTTNTDVNTNTSTANQTDVNKTQTPNNIADTSDVISELKGYSYKKETIIDAESNTKEIYTVKFDAEGKPTISAGYKNENMTESYFETMEIYNVTDDVGAGSVYVDFDFKAFTPGGDVTGHGSIRYSNVTDNEEIGFKARLNIEGNLKDYNNNGDYIYVTRTNK